MALGGVNKIGIVIVIVVAMFTVLLRLRATLDVELSVEARVVPMEALHTRLVPIAAQVAVLAEVACARNISLPF